jgi:amidophosphoribosyltransferase
MREEFNMCGIVGGLAFGKLSKKDEEIRQRLMRFFTTELLIQTEDRGKDATGAAVLFDDTHFMGIKRGEKCSEWLAKFGETSDYFGSLLKVWRTYEHPARIYLGHCRQGTIGDKEENANNHPIKIGNIVGVHNGSIKNHREIVEHLGCKRDGQVDSEVIFRLFAHFTNNGAEPFTLDICQQIVDRLDGEFAVVAYNANNLEQVPIFRDRRPIEFVLIKPFGLLLIVSEVKFWNEVYFAYERALFYNPDMLRKMPSLATMGSKKFVEIETLPDDHALIFDLTKEVKEDTKLKDLCVMKRMERNTKKWTKSIKEEETAATHTVHRSTTTNYNTGSHTTPSHSMSGKKHFSWNNSLGKYVAMVGDKIIDDKTSVVIDIDKKDTTIVKTEAPKPPVKQDESLKGPETDAKEESAGPVTPEVIDMTSYEPDPGAASTPPANSTTKSVATSESKAVEADVIEGQIVEVQMKMPSPEVIEEAKKAFMELPLDEKGYKDEDAVLNDIEVKDADTAMAFGITLIANRVYGMAWRKGYMARLVQEQGKTITKEANDEKTAKREQHIANLKAIVMLLSEYVNKTIKGANDSWTLMTQRKVAEVAQTFEGRFDIAAAKPLFNQFEAAKVSKVFEVLEDYKKFAKETK